MFSCILCHMLDSLDALLDEVEVEVDTLDDGLVLDGLLDELVLDGLLDELVLEGLLDGVVLHY